MEQYNITGMSCAACSARIERAVGSLSGVSSCSVSLLTNSMTVEGSASSEKIIKAVKDAGYGAALKGERQDGKQEGDDLLCDGETPVLLRRLAFSVGFLIALMYLSMGHMVGLPLPDALSGNPIALGLLQLLLSAAVMIINQKFFINGFKGALHLAPNMDTLVALGSAAAFIYSTSALFLMTDAAMNGDHAGAMAYMHEFYFESAAMIPALITVGKTLEARSKGKTVSAIRGLLSLAPKTATVIDPDGGERIIPADDVKIGDVFAVRPGESIPVDGTVIEGHSAINEAALTGESIPSDKAEGDGVFAGTVNVSGYIKCRAERVGEGTTLAHIIKTVSDASASKAPIAKIADRVSGIFVPTVMGIAILTTAIWLICKAPIGFALARGISVLVISCPCALGLATPVAIMVGNGRAAKSGILFRTAAALETAGRTEIVVLDKTGTVTEGSPTVTDVIAAEGFSEEELLSVAYSLEKKSEHPLARAVVSYAEERGISASDASDFEIFPGNGLFAMLCGKEAYGGSMGFIASKAEIPQGISESAQALSESGKTPLFFACGKRLCGLIAVSDKIKPESADAILEMKKMGLRVVMLTGDNARTARAVAAAVGIDEVISDVLPNGKESAIRELRASGRVAMVGDGINDAPALVSADVGIAIGAGSDIAIDSADVVLMKSKLSDVPAAIKLSRAALRNIKENLFWAFFYNSVGIPLAAGAFISLLGWEMSPMIGAAAMSLSSFCVVSNALRLNFFDPYKPSRHGSLQKKSKASPKAQTTQKLTLMIDGMMCSHCEASVREALASAAGVSVLSVSHAEGTAIILAPEELRDKALKKIIKAAGYSLKEISREAHSA